MSELRNKNCDKMAIITNYLILDGIIVATMIVVTMYLYMTRNFNYWKKRGVFEIPPVPFFGNFAKYNPAWKVLRSKLTPLFTSGKLKKMFDLMLNSASKLDTYLESLGLEKLEGEGHTVDVKDLFGKLATDFIGSIVFGIDMKSLVDTNAEFRRRGKAIFDFKSNRTYEVLAVFFVPKIAYLAGIHFFGKKLSEQLREAFWKLIKDRIESGQKRGDLIDILLDFKENYASDMEGYDLNGDDLVAQTMIFFTGGFETSSTAMSFALYELAMHPEMQDKLRKEIFDALNSSDGKITYDMVMTLPYLHMVVSEALRKYPVMPFIDRRAVKTYQLPNSDLTIKKGTRIFLSVFGLHWDPQYFPNPEKFDPERFSEENKSNISAYTYLPFGKGPRMCVGPRLGLLQTKLGIMKMLCRYEVTPCEKTLIPMTLFMTASVTLPNDGELYLNIRKLKKPHIPS
ncbi:PREDICTED: cytochrome P450 6k1-like isoform X2 [Dinoponera quadriceps]|uniref:Cytochrome P450 6k1-like isoform X2 n=1 Tax=Dinoponera quadriceps TaxID=609295 RepID=A0A6P3XEY1_DINQU|nr:PREDICTED: cytochrome P450 6k1-like isoform X2 [Dinoponera quadriceps]